MRILLVQSPSKLETEAIFPLGLLYVATGLENHNNEVCVFDTNTSESAQKDLISLIRRFEPDIIGVGLRNIDNSDYRHYRSFVNPFIELISILKEASPLSKNNCRRAGFSLYAETLMKKVPGLDYSIFNEGE